MIEVENLLYKFAQQEGVKKEKSPIHKDEPEKIYSQLQERVEEYYEYKMCIRDRLRRAEIDGHGSFVGFSQLRIRQTHHLDGSGINGSALPFHVVGIDRVNTAGLHSGQPCICLLSTSMRRM